MRPRPSTCLFQFGLKLQTPERIVPHPFQHLADRPQYVGPRAVQPALPMHSRFDEAGIFEHSKLQRYGAECDIRQRSCDITRFHFVVPEQPQDFAAAR